MYKMSTWLGMCARRRASIVNGMTKWPCTLDARPLGHSHIGSDIFTCINQLGVKCKAPLKTYGRQASRLTAEKSAISSAYFTLLYFTLLHIGYTNIIKSFFLESFLYMMYNIHLSVFYVAVNSYRN